jgi:hypothetical protein
MVWAERERYIVDRDHVAVDPDQHIEVERSDVVDQRGLVEKWSMLSARRAGRESRISASRNIPACRSVSPKSQIRTSPRHPASPSDCHNAPAIGRNFASASVTIAIRGDVRWVMPSILILAGSGNRNLRTLFRT